MPPLTDPPPPVETLSTILRRSLFSTLLQKKMDIQCNRYCGRVLYCCLAIIYWQVMTSGSTCQWVVSSQKVTYINRGCDYVSLDNIFIDN